MNNQQEVSAQYDGKIALGVKITVAVFVVLTVLAALNVVSGFVAISFLLAGLLCCISLMLVKASYTGKRYAQGARARRSGVLPFLYTEKESLEEDLTRYHSGK